MLTTNTENQSSSNLNATLLQSMVEGMILQDQAGQIIQFNQSALDILGTTKEELGSGLVDSPIQDRMFPGKNHIGMQSLLTGQTQRNVILNVFRFDGEMRWISLNSVPIFNDDKTQAVQLISTFTDITEMKRVMNDLKQVQLLFNISHDLTMITNKEGYFKKINPRFKEVLGYSLNEILSQKFVNFIHPDEADSTKAILKKVLESKETTHFIARYKTKNSEYRMCDWVVVPDQETNLMYFTARDITDYRAEELDLIHSSKVYSIGEMTSGIAFALHGELAIIGGHISFIQDQLEKIEPQEFKKKIKHIEESVQRLTKATKGLTSYAHNTENEELVNTTLARILDNVLNLCKERFRVHGVKLDIQVEDGLVIKCKEGQIAHALITLFNNAYDEVHSDRDCWVKFVASNENDTVKMCLSNSAIETGELDPKIYSIPQGIIEENFGKFSVDQSGPNNVFIIEFPKTK